MMTYILMGLLVLGIAFSTMWGIEYDADKCGFMSIEDTTFLRGFWCIIVVLVHVPATYQNWVQDMIGSFAYIGVTFFFMTSAFGLKRSIEHKAGYMEHFWRRRIPQILIPALIANAFEVLLNGFRGVPFSALSFININEWVKVLLFYYFAFWIVYGIAPKIIRTDHMGNWQDISMCLLVFGCSLIDYFTELKITSRWIVEPLGFAYGIMAAKYAEELKKWIKKKWFIKSFVLMVVSGLIGIAYLRFKPVVFWGDYVLKIILGAMITAFIFTVIGRVKVGNKINHFLGDISYEVYLLHQAIFALIMAMDSYTLNSGLFVVISVFITIIAAFFLKMVCKSINKMISSIGGQIN